MGNPVATCVARELVAIEAECAVDLGEAIVAADAVVFDQPILDLPTDAALIAELPASGTQPKIASWTARRAFEQRFAAVGAIVLGCLRPAIKVGSGD